MHVVVVVAGATVVGACDDGGTRAPVTIVVDTDGARAREDAARLRELQKGVQDDRAQLEKAREELAAARKSLETASTTEQKARLARQVSELESRLQGSAAADAVTRDELDLQLRAQEERLKTFISAELGQRPAAAATTATTTTTTTTSPEKATRALLSEATAKLAALRIEAADVNGAEADLALANALARKGEDAAAAAAARAYADKVDAVVVNTAFCRRKYERISQAFKGKPLPPAQRKRAEVALQQAIDKISNGDAVGANDALNAALAVARGS
jgi:chromosome segregation ATPase